MRWGGRLFCVLLIVGGCARRPRDGLSRVTIVYSADVRGAVSAAAHAPGGLARRATLVDRARLTGGALVQVDAGDLAPGPADEDGLADPAARETRARLVLRAYARMGVDATTVGERELAFGAQRWRALCREENVPVVASNVVDRAAKGLFPATTIVSAGDVSVGLFGILELEGDGRAVAPDVVLTDAASAARLAVQTLRRQGARIVVGLFHLAGGLSRARAIAAATTGIDVVVLGHEGPAAPPRFVRAGARGVDVGLLEARVDGRGVTWAVDRVAAATADVPEQVGVRLLVRIGAEPVARTLAESLAALSKASGARVYGENWAYASTPLCLGCHPAQAQQWMTTDHARAFATLEAAGKDREPGCMGCHMTGFLMPGGAQNFESAVQFANVGCEACHGPSGGHVTSMNKSRGTSRTVDGAVCLGCHTPDQTAGAFNVTAALPRILGPGHGRPR